MKTMRLSVVIPVFNEEASLEPLVEELLTAIPPLCGDDFEILLVDDGSSDQSADIIAGLAERHSSHLRALPMRRNCGKARALGHGFAAARGEILVMMDADLQDDPAELRKFIERIEAGADVVTGWKKRRRDPFEKRAASKIFNTATRVLSGLKLHDFNCGFKAMRRDVAGSLACYGELHRYFAVFAHADGFKVEEVEVNHRSRQHGSSKYHFDRYLKGALDLMTSIVLTRYLRRPGHFFGGLGVLFGGIGFMVLAWLSFQKLFLGINIGPRPLFFFGMLLLLAGLQLFSIGLLGEFILRLYNRADRQKQSAPDSTAQ